MYSSRSDHNKSRRMDALPWERPKDYIPKSFVINEGLLDDDEPAMLTKPENINRLHGEALKMHAQWYEDQIDMERDFDLAPWEAELLVTDIGPSVTVAYTSEAIAFSDEVWRARMALELEEAREREAQYDGAYGGYSDDPDHGDHSGCWLPFMRIEELRETFGHNWLGNGFHIVQGNGKR